MAHIGTQVKYFKSKWHPLACKKMSWSSIWHTFEMHSTSFTLVARMQLMCANSLKVPHTCTKCARGMPMSAAHMPVVSQPLGTQFAYMLHACCTHSALKHFYKGWIDTIFGTVCAWVTVRKWTLLFWWRSNVILGHWRSNSEKLFKYFISM